MTWRSRAPGTQAGEEKEAGVRARSGKYRAPQISGQSLITWHRLPAGEVHGRAQMVLEKKKR